ncbi:hypothetical protein QTP88_020176 [Uroleucon formosanum]
MDQWVGSQRAITVKAYYKNGDCLTAVRRGFRRHYNLGGHDRVPSCKAIKSWVENFERRTLKQFGRHLKKAHDVLIAGVEHLKTLVIYMNVSYTVQRLRYGVPYQRMVSLGLIFFEDERGNSTTVTSVRYVAMLKNFAKLNNHPGLENSWFQQDGATAHTARLSMAAVRQFFGEKAFALGDVWAVQKDVRDITSGGSRMAVRCVRSEGEKKRKYSCETENVSNLSGTLCILCF